VPYWGAKRQILLLAVRSYCEWTRSKEPVSKSIKNLPLERRAREKKSCMKQKNQKVFYATRAESIKAEVELMRWEKPQFEKSKTIKKIHL
jgi:hypothetical protein